MKLNSRYESGAKITITGLEEIREIFRRLPDKVASRVVKDAEKRALGLPLNWAKQRWPVRTGKSKKSLRIKISRGPRSAGSGVVAMALLVGGAGATKKGKARPWWSFLIEHGWTLGKRIRKGGKVVGRHPVSGGNRVIKGKHIIKRALKATEERMKSIVINLIVSGMERELRK